MRQRRPRGTCCFVGRAPASAAGPAGRTLAHCLLEMAQKAGRGHVLLLLDKVWQLLNHPQLCCVWSRAGLRRLAHSSVGPLGLPGCEVEIPCTQSLPEVPGRPLTCQGSSGSCMDRSSPPALLPGRASSGQAVPPSETWTLRKPQPAFRASGSLPAPPASERLGGEAGARPVCCACFLGVGGRGGIPCWTFGVRPAVRSADPAPSQPRVLSCEMGVCGRGWWKVAVCTPAREPQGAPVSPGGSFSSVASALQLEFIPDGNNEEVLAGCWEAPASPWRPTARRALIPSAEGPFP